jgi:hypothetical protein
MYMHSNLLQHASSWRDVTSLTILEGHMKHPIDHVSRSLRIIGRTGWILHDLALNKDSIKARVAAGVAK